MVFEEKIQIPLKNVWQCLGFREQPDERTMEKLCSAAARIESSAQPRWVYKQFELDTAMGLKGTGLMLPGRDINAHLQGCHGVIVMAATLGVLAEQEIRRAEVLDMEEALLLDACASALIEAYAEKAEQQVARLTQKNGEYSTTRYSPGYGDLPIALQSPILALLDSERAIGLSVSDSGILLPRKSITALLGVAGHPVTGKLAGCANCALKDKCKQSKGAKLCERESFSIG